MRLSSVGTAPLSSAGYWRCESRVVNTFIRAHKDSLTKIATWEGDFYRNSTHSPSPILPGTKLWDLPNKTVKQIYSFNNCLSGDCTDARFWRTQVTKTARSLLVGEMPPPCRKRVNLGGVSRVLGNQKNSPGKGHNTRKGNGEELAVFKELQIDQCSFREVNRRWQRMRWSSQGIEGHFGKCGLHFQAVERRNLYRVEM